MIDESFVKDCQKQVQEYQKKCDEIKMEQGSQTKDLIEKLTEKQKDQQTLLDEI